MRELRVQTNKNLNFAPVLKFGYNIFMIIYTIGTGNRTIEEFMEILDLQHLCVLKSFPGSVTVIISHQVWKIGAGK